MKKEEFLYSLKYALRCIGRVMDDVVNGLGFALLVGATTGIIVSILIPKISQNQAETKVSRAKNETEITAIDNYRETLATTNEGYVELLCLLEANIVTNPERYKSIVGDVDRKIEELESLIGTLRQIKEE